MKRELQRETWRCTYRYVGVAVVTLLAVVIFHYLTETHSEHSSIQASERLNTKLGRLTITKSLDGVISDLLFLADQQQTWGRFSARVPAQALADNLQAFAAHKRIYDQVRFIDNAGRERVRVNYRDGAAVTVPEAQLQDKSNRFYVRKTRQLGPGQVYVSPFDLNVERGKVEIPAKPVIRFATPVFDLDGNRLGILILNYLGALLLDEFRAASANIADHVFLLNADGYWLASVDQADEWGFMRGREEHFGTRYRDIWKTIRDTESGQFEAAGFLNTFTTVRPLEQMHDTVEKSAVVGNVTWKIVSQLPLSSLQSSPATFIKKNVLLYLPMLLLLATAGVLLGHASARHRFTEARLLFERGFRDVLQGMSLNVVSLDANAAITFHNEAFHELLGWRREELSGCDWVATIVAPESRALARERLAAVAAGGAAAEHSIWLLSRTGERRLVAWHETPLVDDSGDYNGITLLGQEITEGRDAVERAALLSRAIEQSPTTVMITDARGSIEYVNPKFTELTGYTFEDVRGRNPRILNSGHNFDGNDTRLWETISEGGEWRGTLCNRKKNGELYWEDAVIAGVRNLDGEIAHFIAVKVDITEQRRLQERFRHCVEAAPYAMILADQEGRITLVNRQTEKMFGYRRETLLGQPVEGLIPADRRTAHMRDRRHFISGGDTRTMGAGREIVGLHQDGSEFPVEIGLHNFDTEEGHMVLAAVTNVSERKRLEAEIAWRDRQLAQRDALVAVGRMANMVAHDIRNPLSSIKMGLQIVGKRDCVRLDAEARELNAIGLEQVGFVEEVVEDLMTYSRERELNPRWLDLRQVFESALSGLERRLSEANVSLTKDFQEGLPALRGDRTRLRRVLSNLLTNALDAAEALTQRAPEISIAVRAHGNGKQQLRIDICDNAEGIAATDLERIFEPFFTTREQGTGLGLAISRRIVEQHGGHLEIGPGAVCGTRATVILPIDTAVAATGQAHIKVSAKAGFDKKIIEVSAS